MVRQTGRIGSRNPRAAQLWMLKLVHTRGPGRAEEGLGKGLDRLSRPQAPRYQALTFSCWVLGAQEDLRKGPGRRPGDSGQGLSASALNSVSISHDWRSCCRACQLTPAHLCPRSVPRQPVPSSHRSASCLPWTPFPFWAAPTPKASSQLIPQSAGCSPGSSRLCFGAPRPGRFPIFHPP